MFQKLTFVSIFAVVFGLSASAQSKELTNRLGIGIKNNTVMDLPALAAVYYPNANLALTAGAGIDTQKDNSKFTLNAGIRRILFKENFMNFYFGGQLGLITNEVAADKQSGFEMMAVYGGEFFLQGLESLGLTFEGGLAVASLKEVRFRTVGDHMLRAGVIFYF